MRRRKDTAVLLEGDADEHAGTILDPDSLPSCSEDATISETEMRFKPRCLRRDLTENGPRRPIVKRKVQSD